MGAGAGREPRRVRALAVWATTVSTLVSLSATQLACATDPPTTEKELSGLVRDRLSGARISNATVSFTSDTLYRESTRTDGDGHYEMVIETDTPLGQVRAEHPAHQPAEATVFFDAPTRTINLELLPNQ